MQDRRIELQKALAKIIKKNRGVRSITQLSYEIDLSKSIWSELEKGNKDIQLSTFWRIAESFDIKPSELLEQIENELGKNFSFIENTSGQ